MPTLTLDQIRRLVRAEAGQSLNGAHAAQSEDILAERINAAQRELSLLYRFPAMHIEQDVSIVAGTTAYAFPANLGLEEVADVWCSFGSEWLPVAAGIGIEEQSTYAPAIQTWPIRKWEVRVSPTTAAQTLVVWPTPSQAGTLRMSGRKAITPMVAGTDPSTLDGTLIALHVAGLILDRAKAQDAQIMQARALRMGEALMRAQTATQAPVDLGRRRTHFSPRPGIDYIPPR